MTAPDIVSQIEAMHGILAYNGSQVVCACDRTWNPAEDYAAHIARAVLAAISEAGTVEWGTETVHETTGAVLDRDVWQTEKTAREVNRKYGDRVVTRLVTPWVSAE